MSKYENKLPKYCYGVNLSEKKVIILKKNESGYYLAEWGPFNTIEEAKSIADKYNERLGVTKAQASAMSVGSMFGWDVPGANPDNYDADGRPIKIKKETKKE